MSYRSKFSVISPKQLQREAKEINRDTLEYLEEQILGKEY